MYFITDKVTVKLFHNSKKVLDHVTRGFSLKTILIVLTNKNSRKYITHIQPKRRLVKVDHPSKSHSLLIQIGLAYVNTCKFHDGFIAPFKKKYPSKGGTINTLKTASKIRTNTILSYPFLRGTFIQTVG